MDFLDVTLSLTEEKFWPYRKPNSEPLYINKMSNYCANCKYSVNQKNGEKACPFNYLYWDFLARNREKLKNNHRIGMMYKTYDRMPEKKKVQITKDSQKFINSL